MNVIDNETQSGSSTDPETLLKQRMKTMDDLSRLFADVFSGVVSASDVEGIRTAVCNFLTACNAAFKPWCDMGGGGGCPGNTIYCSDRYFDCINPAAKCNETCSEYEDCPIPEQ